MSRTRRVAHWSYGGPQWRRNGARWDRRSRGDVARIIARGLYPDMLWYLPWGQYRASAPMRTAYRRKKRGWR